MTFRETADLLRGLVLSHGLRVPGLATVVEEHADGSFRLVEGITPRDCRLLRLYCREVRGLLAEVETGGASTEEVRGRLAAREQLLRAALDKSLRSAYERIRPLEAWWRGLDALFREGSPDGRGVKLWIWNGRGDGWREEASALAPTIVVTPGTSRPPSRHGQWPGPFPEPMTFGDLALAEVERETEAWTASSCGAGPVGASATESASVRTAASAVTGGAGTTAGAWAGPSTRVDSEANALTGRTSISSRSRSGALGPDMPQDRSLPPSRFAVCTNPCEGRPAYPWEPEPPWVEASWRVAGVHLRRLQNGDWGETGSVPLSRRMLTGTRVRERLTVSRAERLRDAGWIPLGSDDGGVLALGDATRPLPGCRSIGLAALQMEAATSRWITDRIRRVARRAPAGELVDVRREAERLLTVLEERRFVQSWATALEAELRGRERLRVRMTIDESEVFMLLELPDVVVPAVPVLPACEGAPGATREVLAIGREPESPSSRPSATQTTMDAPTESVSAPASLEPRTVPVTPHPEEPVRRFRALLERLFHQPGRKTPRGQSDRSSMNQ